MTSDTYKIPKSLLEKSNASNFTLEYLKEINWTELLEWQTVDGIECAYVFDGDYEVKERSDGFWEMTFTPHDTGKNWISGKFLEEDIAKQAAQDHWGLLFVEYPQLLEKV